MKEMFDVLNKNGEFTNEVESREVFHEKGLWHRAVVVFVINSNNQVLLQKRSASKKMWPNMWDITAGGHVLSGELGYQAAIREAKEEINLDIDKSDMTYIGGCISETNKNGMIDKHFNEYYIVQKDVDINDLTLQEEEVQDIKWFDKEDLIKRINNNYEGLTDKTGLWEYLEKYFEFMGI